MGETDVAEISSILSDNATIEQSFKPMETEVTALLTMITLLSYRRSRSTGVAIGGTQ